MLEGAVSVGRALWQRGREDNGDAQGRWRPGASSGSWKMTLSEDVDSGLNCDHARGENYLHGPLFTIEPTGATVPALVGVLHDC